MSRTDKTDPFWAQLRDPGFRWPIVEHHYHHGCFGTTAECDLDFPLPKGRRAGLRRCKYWPRYIDNDKVWGRGHWRRSFGSFQDRRARVVLRQHRAEWLKTSIDDRDSIDSMADAPTSRWRWRRWYWD